MTRYIGLLFVFFACYHGEVLGKSSNIESLHNQIYVGNAKEVDKILTELRLSTEQSEEVRNLLFQYSYLMTNVELAKVYDKFFPQPDYANNASLLFNKLCSNDFVRNPKIREFVDWMWAEKVKPSFNEKSTIDSFMNDCLEKSLDRGNFDSILWLRSEYLKESGFDISSSNYELIRKHISELKKMKLSISSRTRNQ
jgi:hypothetical protein